MRTMMRALAGATAIIALTACSPKPDTELVTASVAATPVVIDIIPAMSSVMRLSSVGEDGKEAGHGSGVTIGKGLVLTAGHVTFGKDTMKVKTEKGATLEGIVLWSNPKYDVSLVKVGMPDPAATSAVLNCIAPKIGDKIYASGSPGVADFVMLSGTVAGGARKSEGMWENVMIADLSASGGLSGGPVFNKAGEVVGIVVGGMLAPIRRQNDYDLSQTGISYFVPGSTICEMLARV